jgi:hypothetical protein
MQLQNTHLKSFRLFAVSLIVILAGLNLFGMDSSHAGDSPSNKNPDFEVLAGSWTRTDGGYVIEVESIKEDGQVVAKYLNPSPIHVAEANASVEKQLVKLFIKLQDTGYPGSTYTLYYYAEKDALVGFYYQAVSAQTFEVIFLRGH